MSTDLPSATPSETAQALHRSRTFLTTRLLPDLETAHRRSTAIERELTHSLALRSHLRSLDTSTPHRDGKDAFELAEMGEGVCILTKRDETANPLLSLGLGGFYAELTNREARAFLTKRIELLERKKQMAHERLAAVEAHVHLTSTSIAQLDNLFRGGSIVDDV